jgi:Effector protein
MPDLGRWWSIDEKAEKFNNISPYVYVANMPTIAVDPDGKDIFIPFKGNPNSADNRRQKAQVTSSIQKLTNSKVSLQEVRGGYLVKTVEGRVNGNKNLAEGTKLINDLISSDKRVTVTTGEGKENITYKSENGDSKVRFDPTNPADGSKGNAILNADGTSGRPAEIGLAHELIHADFNAKGTVDNKYVEVINPDVTASGSSKKQGDKVITNQDELNARDRENVIRKEQGITPRAEVKRPN